MKTLIAIPCMDNVPVEFAQSLLYMHKGENVNVWFKPNSLIYDSRNQMAIVAVEKGFDYVLWLDSDMVFPPETLIRLREDIENNPDCEMATALYVKRHRPVTPVLYSKIEPPENVNGKVVSRLVDYTRYPQNQLFPVGGCGFGCVMTKTSMLKEVLEKYGPPFTPYPWAGEDISFCYRVNEIKPYRIWCDSRISCGHVGKMIYSDEMLYDGGGNT